MDYNLHFLLHSLCVIRLFWVLYTSKKLRYLH